VCTNLPRFWCNMILDKNKAKEIGEALIDAAEQVSTGQDHAVILLDGCSVAVPVHPEIQDLYETVAIIKV